MYKEESLKYLITVIPFDPASTYEDFGWEVKRFGQTFQISPYHWVVTTSWNSDEMCSKLKHCIDDMDSVFICAFEHWNHINFPETTIDKLSN